MSILCDYCTQPAKLVYGRTLYPHRPDLAEKPFWGCLPCRAYVGCHPGTLRPLGTLANVELRRARSAAHAVFDPIWREGRMKRKQAYAWLQKQLGLGRTECHIGMFDIDKCQRVIEVCAKEKVTA